jgi:hypothetical protein
MRSHNVRRISSVLTAANAASVVTTAMCKHTRYHPLLSTLESSCLLSFLHHKASPERCNRHLALLSTTMLGLGTSSAHPLAATWSGSPGSGCAQQAPAAAPPSPPAAVQAGSAASYLCCQACRCNTKHGQSSSSTSMHELTTPACIRRYGTGCAAHSTQAVQARRAHIQSEHTHTHHVSAPIFLLA